MSRIKQIMKHKGICAILLIEAALLLFFLVKLVIPNKVWELPASAMQVENGNKSADGTYCEIDSSAGMLNFLTTDYMSLPAGTYAIDYDYEAAGNGHLGFVDIEDDLGGFIEEAYDQMYTTNITLDSYNERILKVKLTQATDYFRVRVIYSGDGYLKVNSIQVSETHADEIMAIVVILALSAAVDGLWLWRKKQKNGLTAETKQTIVALLSIIFIASLVLMVPYLVDGHDLKFHLLRIEGIKESILSGQLPAKIQPNWVNGNGYAVSVFYGDLFLYFPAILRVMGFSIHFSYVMYALSINIATCLISYGCFKGMFKNNKAALIGSAVYTLSVYRLINMYLRCAVGEYSAMTFFPLIAYGLWKIFTDDVDSKTYKYNFIIPVIGYTGLIQTHIISCELAGVVTICACLVFIKKVLNKKRFAVLASIVILTAVINAGFLIPFISYLGDDIRINLGLTYRDGTQHYGAFIAQIFQFFTSTEGLTITASDGMIGEMPITTGLAAIVGGLFFAYSWYMGKLDAKYKKAGIFCLTGGVLSVWMATIYFPWDKIQKIAAIAAKVITSFQFPWRYLAAACLLLVIALVIAVKKELEDESCKFKWASFVITALALVQAVWLLSGIMSSGRVLWAYEETSLDTEFLVGCEYLPGEFYAEHYGLQFSFGSDNIDYTELERNQNIITFQCENLSSEEGYAATSIVYYNGYEAVNTQTGEVLSTYYDNGYTYVHIPAGTSGTYELRFVQPWYWILSYVISFMGAAVMVTAIFLRRKAK